jgi:hypothetical protein
MDYVAMSKRVYIIDGRKADGTTQGTAALVPGDADINRDAQVRCDRPCVSARRLGRRTSECCPADNDENGANDASDIVILLGAWCG